MDKESIGNKLRVVFPGIAVYKDAARNKFISSLGIPSFLRDWLLMRFADESGEVDVDDVHAYVERYIPRREQWESLKSEMVKERVSVRFLAKIRVEIDVKTGEGLFSLPDFGFPSSKYEAVIADPVLREKKKALLDCSEAWGVVQLEWRVQRIQAQREQGIVLMTDFLPFRPYKVDLEFFQQARDEFSLEQWIDILLMAVDYNPGGFLSAGQKLAMLSRLLPFVESRLNVIELAPKGTGKSYLFSQLSKYGWLVSGGSVSRARLFYDIGRRQPGLITRHDYVALDEIQSISFPDEEEVRGALKGYLESGEFRIGDYRGVGGAGFVLLGNIDEGLMREDRNMFKDLPLVFHESALFDRFHGFIKGWEIPRMKESLKAQGWALNSEYFSEIMHAMRNDIRYRAVVDEMLDVPKGSDTRDTEAIKRLTSAFLKLLFPNAILPKYLDAVDFERFCLRPAMRMRHTIRRQIHMIDREYSDGLPDVTCRAL